jgi:hypothetical protein
MKIKWIVFNFAIEGIGSFPVPKMEQRGFGITDSKFGNP